jgi:hypothetical protein
VSISPTFYYMLVFCTKISCKAFCTYILGLNFFGRKNIDTNAVIKCLWNRTQWEKKSIKPDHRWIQIQIWWRYDRKELQKMTTCWIMSSEHQPRKWWKRWKPESSKYVQISNDFYARKLWEVMYELYKLILCSLLTWNREFKSLWC